MNMDRLESGKRFKIKWSAYSWWSFCPNSAWGTKRDSDHQEDHQDWRSGLNFLIEFNRYICNRKEPWGRRIVWLFFTSFGLLYTGIIIYKNVSLYQGSFFSMKEKTFNS